MSDKKAVLTNNAPVSPAPLSQAIISGDYVYVSGQRPQIPGTDIIVEGIEAQTEQVLKNIKAILAETGCTMDDVVKTSVFLSDIDLYAPMNKVYKTMFNAPYPARTACGVQLRGIDVEIEAIAKIPRRD